MFDWMFILLTLIAFILMYLSVEYYRERVYFWSFVFTLITIILFVFLGVATLEIEIPYQAVVEGVVVEDVHVITSKTSVEILYLYGLLALIMFIFGTVQVFNMVMSLFKKRNKNNDTSLI